LALVTEWHSSAVVLLSCSVVLLVLLFGYELQT
jgi:hypothetical protein